MTRTRTRGFVPFVIFVFSLLFVPLARAQTTEVIGEIRVHGNHTTPDADILAIAGLAVGGPANEATLGEAAARLEQSGRFDTVDVRKRYRSIDNPNDILVIILVNEVTGVTLDDLTPGALKKFRSLGMWLPVLDYADGYGFTYGARVTFVDALGKRSRISTPLTWGGERRAAVEIDRTFERGPFTRIEGAASINRRVNPHFDVPDLRRELRVRAERSFTSWLRAGGGVRRTSVDFGGLEQSYNVPGFDVTLDTRTDPGFPRNAVHATAAIERLQFTGGSRVTRVSTDVRGYLGLFGSSVLAVRAANIRADNPVPAFEQSLLGGTATLRGYEFGYRAGDQLSVLSAEVRVPLTSPLLVAKLGVKGFIDAGTIYPAGAKLSDQRFDRGAGGGVFMSWAVLRMGLDVAWPISTDSRKPRWHFSLGLTF
jgi:outer membrane translocation and assembly module TamA